MNEKETELLAKGLIGLWEGFCEDCGAHPVGSRVIVCDKPVDRLIMAPPAQRGA